jgi:pyruvate formate lyase activating enzyme
MDNPVTAGFWESLANDAVLCLLCPHYCNIPHGGTGFCGIRTNAGNTGHRAPRLIAAAYGIISGIALDPIEKKPLRHYCPGALILSVGGFGCNMRCPYCQNHTIAETPADAVIPSREGQLLPPAKAAGLAMQYVPRGNIGIAYTYNEPLINYEYIRDCAVAVREAGLKNILVTNGLINPEPLEGLLPYIDAMNIDLKGFTEDYYYRLAGGTASFPRRQKNNSPLAAVKETITRAHRHCHIEITALIVPGENEGHIEPLIRWLAGISPDIPLHLNRFFPRHHYADKAPTPPATLHRLAEAARKHLRHVYTGNL